MSDQEQAADTNQLIDEWEKVIEVQIHFNDLIVKNRQIIMTAVLTVFGAAAFSLQFPNLILEIFAVHFHAAVAIILFGLGLLLSMYFLDYYYYFRLLLGAVDRGEAIERLLRTRSSNQLGGLTISISQAVKRKTAERTLFWFYLIPLILGLLFLLGVFLGYPSSAVDVKKVDAPAEEVTPSTPSASPQVK